MAMGHPIDPPQWHYLYAGMIAGGLPTVQLYQSDSPTYLSKLLELKGVCDSINLDLIDETKLAQYMQKSQLATDIQEINAMYERAILEHRDLLIQLRLQHD